MTRRRWSLFVLGALLALVILAACGPLQAQPTRTPSLPTLVPTSTATPVPTEMPTSAPPASVTSTATTESPAATSTPEATATATDTAQPPPTATSTSVPPTATARPSLTPVPPTATATPSLTPSPVPITDWRGEYYANRDLRGPSSLVRNDRVVDLDLPAGARPAPGLPTESWSARWSRSWRFDEGTYRFRLVVDDGARLWVGGRLLIDAWTDGSAREFTADLYLRGDVPIQLDYYNHLGSARARLNWEPVTQFSGWKGSYYANRTLSGLPLFERDDLEIGFNWGSGSPRSDIPSDDFSVRWTRRLEAGQEGGSYRFRAEADDGMRLWVDGALVIDNWQDGYSSTEAVVPLRAGAHDLRVEFYEHVGGALARLSWTLVPPSPAPTATATPTATPRPTATPTPTPTTPPAAGPVIDLAPEAGPLGVPFRVVGTDWPQNVEVELLLSRPAPKPGQPELVLRVLSDEQGGFEAELAIPEGLGWEGMRGARVVARVPGSPYRAEATYGLLPPLASLAFEELPAREERFALPERQFLALDSLEAWEAWFGAEPPAADPPVDWDAELVLGAFLGPEAEDVELGVERVVRREGTISVWLSVVVPEVAEQEPEAGLVARVLVRIARDTVDVSSQATSTEEQIAFLDASGRLLALGPAGEEALLLPGRGAAARALEAPKEPEAAPLLEEAPAEAEQVAPAMPEAEEAAPAPEAAPLLEEAPAEPEAEEVAPLPEAAPLLEEAPAEGVGGVGVRPLAVVVLVWFLVAVVLAAGLVVAVLLWRGYRSR